MPYRANSLAGQFIAAARWPILFGLGAAFVMQVGSALVPDIKPAQVNVPDLIPPVNTAILALLWWRVGQLEKFKDRQEEEQDRRRQRRERRE